MKQKGSMSHQSGIVLLSTKPESLISSVKQVVNIVEEMS